MIHPKVTTQFTFYYPIAEDTPTATTLGQRRSVITKHVTTGTCAAQSVPVRFFLSSRAQCVNVLVSYYSSVYNYSTSNNHGLVRLVPFDLMGSRPSHEMEASD